MTYAVPEPVGGSREGNTAGTDGQREDLADHYPGTGTPGAGEEEDVDTDEGNHGSDGLVVIVVGDTDDGDDELADNHAESTPQEQRTTTDLLNSVERERSGADVDNGGDDAEQEGVLDCAELGEEGGTEVEDEVDTGPLLHHLKRGTEDGTAQVAVGLPEATAEAVEPAAEVAVLGNSLELVEVVGLNLSQLKLDVLRVDGLATDTGESLASLLLHALANEVTRGFGKEDQTGSKDHSEEHLKTNGDTVRARVGAVLSAVVDAGGQHQTDGDTELVSGNDGTANLARGNLRHVQNNDRRDETDTESSNQTTGNQET